jgi:hypothetical protein
VGRAATRLPAIALILALCLALTACGSGGSGSAGEKAGPTSNPKDFPPSAGKTLGSLLRGIPMEPELAVSTGVLRPGPNRFAFALFNKDGTQLQGLSVALYTGEVNGAGLRGPYPVRADSLAVKPQFRSRTTASDPTSAKAVYVARDVVFPKRGPYGVVALFKRGGKLVASSAIQVNVGVAGPPPVGAKAPLVHTPTLASVGGDASKIDTRLPPDDMHATDLANVLGKKPVVLVFATPQLCKSRVCGPIVDIVEQVKSELGSKADFIHMEIYNDNDIQKGFRPQVRAYGLPSEPWLFAIDRHGRIVDEIEGAASAAEIRAAAERAIAR